MNGDEMIKDYLLKEEFAAIRENGKKLAIIESEIKLLKNEVSKLIQQHGRKRADIKYWITTMIAFSSLFLLFLNQVKVI